MSDARIRRGRIASDVLGEHFTTIYNRAIRDTRLTRRARGLLCELLSHREGFTTSVATLVKQGPEGRDAVENALKELEKFNYLVRERVRDESGLLRGMEYVLTDMPEGLQIHENRRSEPVPENPHLDKPAGQNQDTGNQGLDNQHQENQGLDSRTHKKTTFEEDHVFGSGAEDHLSLRARDAAIEPPVQARENTAAPQPPEPSRDSVIEEQVQQVCTAWRDAWGSATPSLEARARIGREAAELLHRGYPVEHLARLAAELPRKRYTSLLKHAECNPPVAGAVPHPMRQDARDRCPQHIHTLATDCGPCRGEARIAAEQPSENSEDPRSPQEKAAEIRRLMRERKAN